MPTVTETLQAVRASANVNAAALASVRAEAAAALVSIETWQNSPSKGLVRDQVARLLAAYDDAQRQALRLAGLSSNALNTSATLTPDPVPAPVSWSTAAF